MLNRFKLLGVIYAMMPLLCMEQGVDANVLTGYNCADVPHPHDAGCKMTSHYQKKWKMPVEALVINDGYNESELTCQNNPHYIQCNQVGSHTRLEFKCKGGHFVALPHDKPTYYYCSN